MTADTERSLLSLVDPHRRRRQVIALHGIMGMLVVFVGALGLLDDSWLRELLAPWINIHALFGLLLWGLVVAGFYWRVTDCPPRRPADVREISRHLSRIVYLLLYLVIGARQVVSAVTFMRHGGAFDFGLIHGTACVSGDCAIFEPTKDFQAILVYGLVTLVIIRGLAAWYWLRFVNNAASMKAPVRGSTRLQIPSD